MTWLTGHKSVAFYPSLEEVEAIHGHDGKTKIVTGTEIGPRRKEAVARPFEMRPNLRVACLE